MWVEGEHKVFIISFLMKKVWACQISAGESFFRVIKCHKHCARFIATLHGPVDLKGTVMWQSFLWGLWRWRISTLLVAFFSLLKGSWNGGSKCSCYTYSIRGYSTNKIYYKFQKLKLTPSFNYELLFLPFWNAQIWNRCPSFCLIHPLTCAIVVCNHRIQRVSKSNAHFIC